MQRFTNNVRIFLSGNVFSQVEDITFKVTKIYIGKSVKMIAEIVVLNTNEILKLKGYLEE